MPMPARRGGARPRYETAAFYRPHAGGNRTHNRIAARCRPQPGRTRAPTAPTASRSPAAGPDGPLNPSNTAVIASRRVPAGADGRLNRPDTATSTSRAEREAVRHPRAPVSTENCGIPRKKPRPPQTPAHLPAPAGSQRCLTAPETPRKTSRDPNKRAARHRRTHPAARYPHRTATRHQTRLALRGASPPPRHP
ncbi:hypothetical protein GCM10010437_043440 [Actinoplanes palleronii]